MLISSEKEQYSVSKELSKRGTAQQAGVNINMAPSLQAATKHWINVVPQNSLVLIQLLQQLLLPQVVEFIVYSILQCYSATSGEFGKGRNDADSETDDRWGRW